VSYVSYARFFNYSYIFFRFYRFIIIIIIIIYKCLKNQTLCVSYIANLDWESCNMILRVKTSTNSRVSFVIICEKKLPIHLFQFRILNQVIRPYATRCFTTDYAGSWLLRVKQNFVGIQKHINEFRYFSPKFPVVSMCGEKCLMSNFSSW